MLAFHSHLTQVINCFIFFSQVINIDHQLFIFTGTYLFISYFHRYVAKQLPGIGLTFSSALVNAGITSVDKVAGTDPREIEMITGKRPPFGNNLRDAAKSIPNYVMQVNQVWFFWCMICIAKLVLTAETIFKTNSCSV